MDSFEDDNIWWSRPEHPNGIGLLLTHGAGGNANAPLLRAVADACACAGVLVARYNLPFRQKRPGGPPHPSGAALDRDGLKEMAARLRKAGAADLVIGGHSYGGRQASILVSEQHEVADRLLLLSYPLHPPGKPAQLRTQHFPGITIPTMFASGSKDEFGTPQELDQETAAVSLGRVYLIEGAGHDLKKGKVDLAPIVKFVCYSAKT